MAGLVRAQVPEYLISGHWCTDAEARFAQSLARDPLLTQPPREQRRSRNRPKFADLRRPRQQVLRRREQRIRPATDQVRAGQDRDVLPRSGRRERLAGDQARRRRTGRPEDDRRHRRGLSPEPAGAPEVQHGVLARTALRGAALVALIAQDRRHVLGVLPGQPPDPPFGHAVGTRYCIGSPAAWHSLLEQPVLPGLQFRLGGGQLAVVTGGSRRWPPGGRARWTGRCRSRRPAAAGRTRADLRATDTGPDDGSPHGGQIADYDRAAGTNDGAGAARSVPPAGRRLPPDQHAVLPAGRPARPGSAFDGTVSQACCVPAPPYPDRARSS